MKQHNHDVGALEWLTTAIFEVWLWVTIGLLAIVAFFGRRLLKKWDAVTDSHMPSFEIERRFLKLNEEMTDCQEEIKSEQKSAHKELMGEVGDVHKRLDNLYQLLLQKGK